MKYTVLVASAILILFTSGCGPLGGDAEVDLPPLDEAVVDRVVADLMNRMAGRYDEAGPQFVTDLPKLKDDAAAHEGFEDWVAFKKRLNGTSPDLEVRVAERITSRIGILLAKPRSE